MFSGQISTYIKKPINNADINFGMQKIFCVVTKGSKVCNMPACRIPCS